MNQVGCSHIVMIWRICFIRQWMEKRCVGHASMPKRNAHLLSLYECESGIVIAQEAVKDKENEITASAALLHPCLVKGRIITADAMHTQKKFCTTVYVFGGHYLLVAKENQPGMLQDLVDFFAEKDLDQGEWQHYK